MSKRAVPPRLPATPRIASVKNNYIQHCVKLRTNRSYREACQRLLLVGREVIQEVLDSKAEINPRSLFLSENGELAHDERFEGNVFYVSQDVLKKLTGMQSSPDDEAVAELDYPSADEEWRSERVLMLDGVQDPGNVGTLLRTAVCFDWRPVLLLPNCCDAFNDKVLKACRGSVFKIPVIAQHREDLPGLLESKNLIPVAATVRHDGVEVHEIVDEMDKRGKGVCLFLGSEGRGLSEEVQQLCSQSIKIPHSTQMESLNVAVAGGILMYLLSPFSPDRS